MFDVLSRWRRVMAIGLGLLIAVAAVRLQGQSGVTLGGKVLDPDAKVVVNAAVIVRNEATNEIRTTATDGDRPLFRRRV